MTPRFLSQARLDRTAPVAALTGVLDPFDEERAIDVHHRLVWTLFADREDRERDFLWRVDDGQFLILSERQPEDRHGLFELRTKLFEPVLSTGDTLTFRLRVNAVVTRTSVEKGRRQQRRHDIVMDRLLRELGPNPTEDGRAKSRDVVAAKAAEDWLRTQGQRSGFELLRLDGSDYRTVRLPRRGKADASFGLLDLDGRLRVTEPSTLLKAIGRGFGKGKAFGCGLMLVRRA